MTREELHTFAAAGVAQKIASIERDLAVFHKEWPELFLSPTPPQLLKPALKNGHTPTRRVETAASTAPLRSHPRPKPKRQTGAATREKLAIRERTARVLALIEEKGPLTSAEITAGVGRGGRIGYSPLLQAGLLTKVRNKYKRTAKPFMVDWRTGARGGGGARGHE